jgi:hypothetical protein
MKAVTSFDRRLSRLGACVDDYSSVEKYADFNAEVVELVDTPS